MRGRYHVRGRSRTRGPPRGGAAKREAQIARIVVSQAQQSCRASIAAAVALSLAVQPRLRVRPNPPRRPPKWLARRQRGNGARNAPPLTAGRRGGGTGMPSTYPMCAKGRVSRAGAAGHVMLSRREKKVQPVRIFLEQSFFPRAPGRFQSVKNGARRKGWWRRRRAPPRRRWRGRRRGRGRGRRRAARRRRWGEGCGACARVGSGAAG